MTCYLPVSSFLEDTGTLLLKRVQNVKFHQTENGGGLALVLFCLFVFLAVA